MRRHTLRGERNGPEGYSRNRAGAEDQVVDQIWRMQSELDELEADRNLHFGSRSSEVVDNLESYWAPDENEAYLGRVGEAESANKGEMLNCDLKEDGLFLSLCFRLLR